MIQRRIASLALVSTWMFSLGIDGCTKNNPTTSEDTNSSSSSLATSTVSE